MTIESGWLTHPKCQPLRKLLFQVHLWSGIMWWNRMVKRWLRR